MKEFNRDILQEASLKNSPYSVPEGYFESLKEKAVKYVNMEDGLNFALVV